MRFEKNIKGKDFIVGDLHGMYDLLHSRLTAIGFDKTKDRLFSVGDLIDRGNKSMECLSLIREDWFFAVRGNHEQMMCDALPSMDQSKLIHWIGNGGDWAFSDEVDTDELGGLILEVKDSMPLWMEVEVDGGAIGIVHAEPPNDWLAVINGEQKEHILWSRTKIKNQDDTVIKNIDRVYVGHTPLKKPANLGNTRYIDTCAFYTGVLTVERLSLETDQ